MRSKKKVAEYLEKAEQSAIKSLAQNKWLMFGYWAAMAVHLRKVLGVSHTASPFREFAELARAKIKRVDSEGRDVTGLSGLWDESDSITMKKE